MLRSVRFAKCFHRQKLRKFDSGNPEIMSLIIQMKRLRSSNWPHLLESVLLDLDLPCVGAAPLLQRTWAQSFRSLCFDGEDSAQTGERWSLRVSCGRIIRLVVRESSMMEGTAG